MQVWGSRFQEMINGKAKHSLPPGSFPHTHPTPIFLISQPKLKCCYISLEEMALGPYTAGNELMKKNVAVVNRAKMDSQELGNSKAQKEYFAVFSRP